MTERAKEEEDKWREREESLCLYIGVFLLKPLLAHVRVCVCADVYVCECVCVHVVCVCTCVCVYVLAGP